MNLDTFCGEDFIPSVYAQQYYQSHTEREAEEFKKRLSEHKNHASKFLRDKIFQYCPDILLAGQEVSIMEKRVGVMRKYLEKSEINLDTILEAANILQRVGHEAPHSPRNAQTTGGTPVQDKSLKRAIDLSKFRRQRALSFHDAELRWVVDAPDTLALYFFHDQMLQAVELIFKMREFDATKRENLWILQFAKILVDEQAESLSQRLADELLTEYQAPQGVDVLKMERHPVPLLRKLSRAELACRSFLDGRTAFVQGLVDKVLVASVSQDPERCVLELAQRTFRVLLDTNFEFNLLFAEADGHVPNTMLSKFMVWANERVVQYCDHFIRFLLPGYNFQANTIELTQEEVPVPFDSEKSRCRTLIFLSDDEWTKLGNCLRWTLLMARRLEKDGLCFSFVIAREMEQPLHHAIKSLLHSLEMTLRYQLSHESWTVDQMQVEAQGKNPKSLLCLTTSSQSLYENIHGLMRKVKKIYSTNYSTTTSDLESTIVEGAISVIGTYLKNLVHIAGAWCSRHESKGGTREEFENFVLSCRKRGITSQAIYAECDFELSVLDKRVITVLTSDVYSIPQLLGMMADTIFISTDLVRRIGENVEKMFRKKVSSLKKFQEHLTDLETDRGNDTSPTKLLFDAFVTRTAHKLLEDFVESHWYTPNVETNAPVEKLEKSLSDIRDAIERCIGDSEWTKSILAAICEFVVKGLPIHDCSSIKNKKACIDDLVRIQNLTVSLVNIEPSDQVKEIMGNFLSQLR